MTRRHPRGLDLFGQGTLDQVIRRALEAHPLRQQEELTGDTDEIARQPPGESVQQIRERQRKPDHPAFKQFDRPGQLEVANPDDDVEGAVEDIAEDDTSPLERAHRVLRDGDEEEAVRNSEDGLDVVEEALCGVRLHLVELVDPDPDLHVLCGDQFEEVPEQADDVRVAHLSIRQLGPEARLALESEDRRLEAAGPARGVGLLKPDLAQPDQSGVHVLLVDVGVAGGQPFLDRLEESRPLGQQRGDAQRRSEDEQRDPGLAAGDADPGSDLRPSPEDGSRDHQHGAESEDRAFPQRSQCPLPASERPVPAA